MQRPLSTTPPFNTQRITSVRGGLQ